MSNCSQYQKYYWYPRVAEDQHGEYCRGCGFSPDSKWWVMGNDGVLRQRKFTGLVLDKINNNGNHNICDNKSTDFQLLCKSCNHIKNPKGSKHVQRDMTESEATNRRAEKPLMEWLFERIQNREETSWSWFVAEGSFRFNISPETIDRRYYKKYFEAESAPFELYHDQKKGIDMIRFKEHVYMRNDLDIDTYPHPYTANEKNLE